MAEASLAKSFNSTISWGTEIQKVSLEETFQSQTIADAILSVTGFRSSFREEVAPGCLLPN